MGILDKAKDLLSGHADTAKDGVDKVAEKADDATGNKYGDKLDQGAERLKGGIDSMRNRGAEGTQQAEDGAQQATDQARDFNQ
jgi:uncharacterized phage infection (PIP) family protein YhgE